MASLLWLGRVGLVLDLVGATLILWGGTPPIYRPRYATWAPDDYDPKKEEEEWDAKVKLWERRNRFGLVLLILGFALQLAGTWGK